MKKLIILICLLTALFPWVSAQALRADAAYDAAAAKVNAQNDLANWMSYLPDDVFVAHLSIPGTHDTATAHNVSQPTLSQTQTATLDDQLAGGLRAFDFRPGLEGSGSNQYLNCNHGISTTDLRLEQAFTKLTDFLDAHPNEFFVIHLFRGNVPNKGTNLTFGKNSDSDRETYNRLFDEFFNKGKFSNYIVDYSPYLKVKDMRGKMVIFRRDRIEFAHIAKAGNLSGWPGDTEQWTESSVTPVVNASDPTIKGSVTVTDVSSPSNEAQLNIELQSIRDINAYARTQVRPNEAKRAGSYKPKWVMCFTSGEYTSGRTGYANNASYTNPLLTQLIKESEVKGPAGIIFSDWVLTDSYGSYQTKGVELIPTIINNNFDYISEFILDDELFAQMDVEAFWDNGKQYFMRNVGTGNFLSAGRDWGTHAALNKYGIKVSPVMEEDGSYTINTTLNNSSSTNGGALGEDMYVDNPTPAHFTVTHMGGGKFVFTKGGKNLAAANEAETGFQDDGTTHNVDMVDANNEDPNQQWELLEIDQYFKDAIAQATPTNGVDVSYCISGHRFFGNDTENSTWVYSTNNQGKCDNPGGGEKDHQRVLRMYNEDRYNRLNWNTGWTLRKEVTGLPNGIYKLTWDAYAANISDETMTINGEVFVDEYSEADGRKVIKRGSVTPTTTRSGRLGSYTYTYNMDMATAISEMNTGNHRCSIDLNIKDGKLTIEASAPTHSSSTAFLLDNFTLTYYGPDPAAACDFLAKVIKDTEDRMANLTESQREGWDEVLQPYRQMVEEKTVVGDGTVEAYEIYGKLREHLQKFADVEEMNMTGAIINPNFELGTGFGWNIVSAGDTGVKENAGDYTMSVNTDDKAGARVVVAAESGNRLVALVDVHCLYNLQIVVK